MTDDTATTYDKTMRGLEHIRECAAELLNRAEAGEKITNGELAKMADTIGELTHALIEINREYRKTLA